MDPFLASVKALEAVDWKLSAEFSTSDLEAIRIHGFRLQSLGRIFKKSSKKKQNIIEAGTNLRTQSKFIEDAIGGLLAVHEMKAALGERAGEDAIRDRLLIEELDEKKRYIALSESLRLQIVEIAKNPILQIDTDWDFRKLYRKGFRRSIRKVAKDIQILDPNLLEDGTHKLRRKIRWVIMGLIYPHGLFAYKDVSENVHFDAYTTLAPTDREVPILLHPKPVVEISRMIRELGEVKDKGLFEFHWQRLHGNLSYGDINTSSPHIVKKTQFIIDSISSAGWLRTLEDDLSR